MRVEYLLAREDRTWDTVIVNVPDDAYEMDDDNDPVLLDLTAYGENILVWDRSGKFQDVVMWAVYAYSDAIENDEAPGLAWCDECLSTFEESTCPGCGQERTDDDE